MGREAEVRLLLAMALSAALHFSLIYGVAVGGLESEPARVIFAHLQPAADARQVEHIPAAPTGVSPRFIDTTPKAQHAASSVPTEPLPAPAVPSVRDDSRAPVLEVPALVDPTWYTAKDLDVYPQALAPVDAPYPASVSDVTGEVTVLLAIDEFGAVQDSSVVTAQPPGYFDESALGAFRMARFAPAQRDGKPVRSRIVVKMRFAPQPGRPTRGARRGLPVRGWASPRRGGSRSAAAPTYAPFGAYAPPALPHLRRCPRTDRRALLPLSPRPCPEPS